MKTCKLSIALAAFLCVALGMLSVAQAALSQGDNLTFESMSPVKVSLYDLDNNGTATLSANTLSVGGNPGFYLAFSTNGTDFSELGTSTTIDYAEKSPIAQVYFRLQPSNGDALPIDTGVVTFQNYDENESNAVNLSLFHAFFVDWDSGQFTVTFASTNDRFDPVPIPASALLLATGLIGLVGFRRQMKKR